MSCNMEENANLTTLRRVEVSSISKNIIEILQRSLLDFGGMTKDELGSKVMCLNCDGDFDF